MLRITTIDDAEGPRLKLEGKLLGPWADELRVQCAAMANEFVRPRLDLEAVTYVDSAGVGALQDLQAEGFRIIGCSPFVAMILREENR